MKTNYKNLLLIFFLCFSSTLYCETITFSANQLKGNTTKEKEFTHLIGNAHIETETMIISADEIKLSGEDFVNIEAKGNVSGKNTESDLDFTCETLLFNRTTKIALLQTKVTLNDVKNSVVAKAQNIEYDQNSEIAIMQIDVNITQKNNLCTSALAIYRKDEQILEMSGNPKITRDKDVFEAREITLNMETEEIYLDGKVRGSVVDEKKETEKAVDTSSEINNPPEETTKNKD